MNTYGGVEKTAPPFVTSALDVGEWSASRSGRFTLCKNTRCPLGRRILRHF
jgi:hypothetical protein